MIAAVSSIRVVLVDDHAVVRRGIRAMLAGESDFELVGEAEDAAEAMQLIRRLRPDVVVLDLVLRGIQGLEILNQIRDQPGSPRVVVLSMHQDVAYVVEALRRGASGYVLKAGAPEDLSQALRAAMAGKRWLSPGIDPAVVEAVARRMQDNRRLYDTLTRRQGQVCQLAAQGYTNEQMSAALGIARRTVESHRFRMMHRLGLRNHTELVAFAIREGVIPGPATGATTGTGLPQS
jgi:DNA-binding NarL/FixJ family response regulator